MAEDVETTGEEGMFRAFCAVIQHADRVKPDNGVYIELDSLRGDFVPKEAKGLATVLRRLANAISANAKKVEAGEG